MTDRLLSRSRRRAAVSLSLPVPGGEPVEQLDRAVELIHRVNRTMPQTVLGRDELVALGGLLTQISGALLTLAELLVPPVHHYDRTRVLPQDNGTTAHRRRQAAGLLLECRDGYLAASTAARAFHADLRRCAPAPGAADQ